MVLLEHDGDLGAAAPDQANGDIRRARVVYSEHRITGSIDFAALDRPDARLIVGVDLRWKDAVQYRYGELVIFASAGRPEGVARFSGDGRCAAAHHIDYENNRVTFSVPSSCLGDPPWIQTIAGAFVRARHSGGYGWLDTSPDERYGPRIHRG